MSDSANPPRSRTGPIFLTLCGLLVIVALATVPWVAGPPSEQGMPDLAKFLGRFHPVFLHLPIGMLLLVLVLEIGHFIPRNRTGYSTRMAMFFAAASAVIATILGLLLYYGTGNYRDEIAERHLNGGLIFACGMVAAFVVKVWVDFANGKGTWLYWLLLLGSTGMMGIASHDGGSLTHGEGYLTAYAPDPIRRAIGLPAKEDDATGTEPVVAKPPGEQVVYTDLLVPILSQKCYSCHSLEKKVKGKYRMEEYDLLVKGGSEGEGIVPGKSAESNVITRLDLPEDDEEHMPPEDEPQLEAHELLLIRWWIDSGASKDATLSSLQPDDEIAAAVAKLAAANETAATAEPEEPSIEVSEAVKADVERLQKEFPAALNFESQSSGGLVFTAVSMRDKFGDDALAKLEPVMSAMISLDLSASTVTDEGAKVLANATALKSLRLSETAVTDASLEVLAKLSQLESLNLYGTEVTNAGVAKLAALPGLKKLYLWQTKVDAAGVQALQEKLPGCDIVMGL